MRFEAIAFRFTILAALLCVLVFVAATWMAIGNARTAERKAEVADRAMVADTLACDRSGHTTEGSDPLGLFCDRADIANRIRETHLAYSFAERDRARAVAMAIFAVVLPALAFLAFYTIRWLFTGRFTPLWPLRKTASARD